MDRGLRGVYAKIVEKRPVGAAQTPHQELRLFVTRSGEQAMVHLGTLSGSTARIQLLATILREGCRVAQIDFLAQQPMSRTTPAKAIR